jgi:hypothetical protein
MLVVPKLVEPLLMAAREQRNSYPGFFHFAIRLPSTTFSRIQKSYLVRTIELSENFQEYKMTSPQNYVNE